MKKQFLFVAVAALVMASCSEDEQMAVNQDRKSTRLNSSHIL